MLGVDRGLVFRALVPEVVDASPAAERSVAVGSLNACADLGYAAGAVGLGAVAGQSSYATAYLIAAAVVGCAFVASVARGR